MEAGAMHYSLENLTSAGHTWKLRYMDETVWNLDYKQCGIGNGACGPRTLPEYLVPCEMVEFKVTLYRPHQATFFAETIKKHKLKMIFLIVAVRLGNVYNN